MFIQNSNVNSIFQFSKAPKLQRQNTPEQNTPQDSQHKLFDKILHKILTTQYNTTLNTTGYKIQQYNRQTWILTTQYNTTPNTTGYKIQQYNRQT